MRGTDHYVSSKLVTSDQTVTFIYRMRQFGSSWKIIDVLLDGSISQLNVYRSDFAATMKAGGAAGAGQEDRRASADKALKRLISTFFGGGPIRAGRKNRIVASVQASEIISSSPMLAVPGWLDSHRLPKPDAGGQRR